jgi:hypothetical protein
MVVIYSTLLLLLGYITSNNLTYTGKTRSLVLLDDWHHIETHSLFWDQIKEMGFDLDFKMIDDPNIKLSNFGEYFYNNVIYFAPTYNEGI